MLRRFGIEVVDVDFTAARLVLSMPMNGMHNPFTGEGSVAALAMLVDVAGGVANHFLRPANAWSMSTELSLDFSSEYGPSRVLADADTRVVVDARTIGAPGSSPLCLCTLTSGDSVIGLGTVRSVYVSGDRRLEADDPSETLTRTPQTTLADLIAVQTTPASEEMRVLRQRDDPILRNAVGVVHGGVASAGMEIAASAMMNADGASFRTSSIRVNFQRPFYGGDQCRYVATPLRIGRTAAICDAQAVGADGKIAITARVSGYR